MGVVMGVMVIFMVVGSLGFGHHHWMTGGHGAEGHSEVTAGKEQVKDEPCEDCSVKARDELKNGVIPAEGASE